MQKLNFFQKFFNRVFSNIPKKTVFSFVFQNKHCFIFLHFQKKVVFLQKFLANGLSNASRAF
jgi:hypothetical protein